MKSLITGVIIFLTHTFSHSATGPAPCKGKIQKLSKDGFQVEFLKFVPSKKSDKTIIIFPPTGGTNFLDRSYAKEFCKDGHEVMVVSSWTGHEEYALDLGVHLRIYSGAQRALSLILDTTSSKHIGVLGTSVGGIHASVAASTQDRVTAVFIITSGAPFASIITYSDQAVLVEGRKKRMEMFKFKDLDEYETALKEAIPLDPFLLPPNFKNKKLGMVISTSDTTVPFAYQNKLKELWNPKTVYTFSDNHIFAILKTWFFHKKDILIFFNSAAK